MRREKQMMGNYNKSAVFDGPESVKTRRKISFFLIEIQRVRNYTRLAMYRYCARTICNIEPNEKRALRFCVHRLYVFPHVQNTTDVQ